MKTSLATRLRRIWLNVHLWIGIGLAVLLVPIGLSGSFLVWHDAIDPWLYPARYAVTAQDRMLPASEYVASAGKALGANLLGGLVGGLLQTITFVIGIKALLLIVAGLYLAALATRPRRRRSESIDETTAKVETKEEDSLLPLLDF